MLALNTPITNNFFFKYIPKRHIDENKPRYVHQTRRFRTQIKNKKLFIIPSDNAVKHDFSI